MQIMDSKSQPEPILLSVSDAAAMLRLSRPTVYKLLNAGVIRAVKSGSRTLIPIEAVRDYAVALPPYEPPARNARTARGGAQPEIAPPPSKIIRAKEVVIRTGLSRTSIYTRSADGTFPTRIPLGGRASGWREAAVDDWIADPINYRVKP